MDAVTPIFRANTVEPRLVASAARPASTRLRIAIRGGAWSLGGYIGGQLFKTVATLILARYFLGPETFGVLGIVAVFLAGLSMFSELGIQANVVQHARGDDPQFLNTAFSIQLARGVAIWFAAVAAAAPLSAFYQIPELFSLLVVAGGAEVLRGMVSTSVCTLTRHIQLSKITLLNLGSEIVAFGVCIAWAMISPSAWALVARSIAAAGVLAIGSHFVAKPSVRPAWDPAAARDILHFGGWVSLATAAHFIAGQGERLILGKFITPAELGCFSLAIMISTVPAAGVGQLVTQIFLPMLSQSMRTGGTAAATDYARARAAFAGIGLLAATGFLALGQPLVRSILGADYQMTGWMLQLLGVRVALDLFAAPSSSLMMAFGKTQYSAAANTVRLILMISGIWFALVHFGIWHAILALIIAQALSYFPLIFGMHKLLPQSAAREARWYLLFLAVIVLLTFISRPGL
jgi:O-antigen/teichoic acid export membrane protein